MTPRTAEATNSRENKDPKRTKMQQTIKGFLEEVNKNKQEKIQRNVVAQVREKRLQSGRRLVPSGASARIRAERAAQAMKEAEEANKDERSKRTISFGTGNSNSKTVTPMKSALKKGPKETIKVFKCELVVDVKVKVNYTRKKSKVRKQVCNCLEGTLDFIQEMLLEGKSEVAFLGKKEGNPKRTPSKRQRPFPLQPSS